jgi:hypothetical protein
MSVLILVLRPVHPFLVSIRKWKKEGKSPSFFQEVVEKVQPVPELVFENLESSERPNPPRKPMVNYFDKSRNTTPVQAHSIDCGFNSTITILVYCFN